MASPGGGTAAGNCASPSCTPIMSVGVLFGARGVSVYRRERLVPVYPGGFMETQRVPCRRGAAPRSSGRPKPGHASRDFLPRLEAGWPGLVHLEGAEDVVGPGDGRIRCGLDRRVIEAPSDKGLLGRRGPERHGRHRAEDVAGLAVTRWGRRGASRGPPRPSGRAARPPALASP